MTTEIPSMVLQCHGTGIELLWVRIQSVRAASFFLCSQKSRESLLILELYLEHRARNVCPLLYNDSYEG